MARSPSLTIVVPTWCEAGEIEEAVQCALRIADEVVVADAGSPDGTASLAESAGARVAHAPKRRDHAAGTVDGLMCRALVSVGYGPLGKGSRRGEGVTDAVVSI
jgi:glycosyltransferase involved in cell wall biosynthesis